MFKGFPVSLLSVLRCPSDSGTLRLQSPRSSEKNIMDGQLRCDRCSRDYRIDGGIVRLLDESSLHPESYNEMKLRDAKSKSFKRLQRKEWRSDYDDISEIEPTIRELLPLTGKYVAEFGCGTGRYTVQFCRKAAAVLALDFSIESLCVLATKEAIGTNTGLVQADILNMRLVPRTFDRVLSTLHSNLPTRDLRVASNRRAADLLKDNGRYVFSMHYHGIRNLLLGVPRSGYYPESGIYRYHMRTVEAKQEIIPCFSHVRFIRLKVNIPGIRSIFVSKTAQRVPVLNEMAQLLLCVAEQPIRNR